jgi:hypothetical protein
MALTEYMLDDADQRVEMPFGGGFTDLQGDKQNAMHGHLRCWRRVATATAVRYVQPQKR